MPTLLDVVANPNVAYVLFILGLLGVITDVYVGGIGIAGIAGAIALVLGLYGFGALPVSAVGAALLVLAIGLVIAELHVPSAGLLAVLGLIVFVVASSQLFEQRPRLAAIQVHPAVVVVTGAVLAGVALGVFRALLRVRGSRIRAGSETLIGTHGVATTDIRGGGRVRVDGEEWTARTSGTSIHGGEEIEVVGIEGVTLDVRRASAQLTAYRGGLLS